MKKLNTKIKATLSLCVIVSSGSVFADISEQMIEKPYFANNVEKQVLGNKFNTKKDIINAYAEQKGVQLDKLRIIGNYIASGDSLIHINELRTSMMMNKTFEKQSSSNQITTSALAYNNGYRVAILPPREVDIKNITVSVKYSPMQTNYVPSEWIQSMKSAISELNDIEAEFSFTWVSQNSGIQPDIGLLYTYNDFPLDNTKTAAAPVGNVTDGVGDTIWINANIDNGTSSSDRLETMMHELLHTVGFHHRGSTDGVMLPGSNTWYTWCTNSVLDSSAGDKCWVDDKRIKEINYL